MTRVVVISGTATEVGKTWVGAAAAHLLRQAGIGVAARKPVQSFEPGDDAAGRTDAHRLGAATGESPALVCPPGRWYGWAAAPPHAARHLGLPSPRLHELVAELSWPADADVVVVEGVGGPRSPLAEDGDTVDLARLLAPALVVVVADAGLGAINAVRLSAGAFAGHPVAVVLNRFDTGSDLHQDNLRWLADRDGFEVVASAGELAARLG